MCLEVETKKMIIGTKTIHVDFDHRQEDDFSLVLQ